MQINIHILPTHAPWQFSPLTAPVNQEWFVCFRQRHVPVPSNPTAITFWQREWQLELTATAASGP